MGTRESRWHALLSVIFLGLLLLAFPTKALRPQIFCPVEEPDSRSEGAEFCGSILRVRNLSENNIQISWVDSRGNEVQKGFIKKGQAKDLHSCMNHLWRAREETTHRLISEKISAATAVQDWEVLQCTGLPLDSDYQLHANLGFGRGSLFLHQGNLEKVALGGGGMGQSFVIGQDGRMQSSAVSSEIVVDVDVDLEMAYNGGTVPITYEHQVACRACHGTGRGGAGGGGGGKEPAAAEVACDRCGGRGLRTSSKKLSRDKKLQHDIHPSVTKHKVCGKCEGFGTVVENKKDPICEKCRGERVVRAQKTFDFDIPPGVYDGYSVRYKGRGHINNWDIETKRMLQGDLVVLVHIVNNEQHLDTCNGHILRRMELTIDEALHGFTKYIPHFNGQDLKAQKEGFTFPGETLRLRGGGLPPLGGRPRGDLVLHFAIDLPEEQVHDHDGDGRRQLFLHLLKTLQNEDGIDRICKLGRWKNEI